MKFSILYCSGRDNAAAGISGLLPVNGSATLKGEFTMKNVIITISGGMMGVDGVELVTGGTLKHEGQNVVLEYCETELSGVDGTCTRIVMSEQEVLLERFGTSQTFLHFENQKSSIAKLKTDFAGPDDVVSVYTHDLSFSENDSGGSLGIYYTLGLNGNLKESNICLRYQINQ